MLQSTTTGVTIETRLVQTQREKKKNRVVAWNLEVQLLIPTESHSAANRSSAHQKWQWVETSWTTSEGSSRHGTPCHQASCSPNLDCAEILGPWILNCGGAGEALSECDVRPNILDSVPNMQTQLLFVHAVDCSEAQGCTWWSKNVFFLKLLRRIVFVVLDTKRHSSPTHLEWRWLQTSGHKTNHEWFIKSFLKRGYIM